MNWLCWFNWLKRSAGLVRWFPIKGFVFPTVFDCAIYWRDSPGRRSRPHSGTALSLNESPFHRTRWALRNQWGLPCVKLGAFPWFWLHGWGLKYKNWKEQINNVWEKPFDVPNPKYRLPRPLAVRLHNKDQEKVQKGRQTPDKKDMETLFKADHISSVKPNTSKSVFRAKPFEKVFYF